MKKDPMTKYLAVFLLVCLVLDGILLCGFAQKDWWNNWMVMVPNLFMILGAFYCHLMKTNTEKHPGKLTWYYVYKAIKIGFTVLALVLYLMLVKQNGKAFVIITAISYLIALVTETCVYTHYIKNLNKESKA